MIHKGNTTIELEGSKVILITRIESFEMRVNLEEKEECKLLIITKAGITHVVDYIKLSKQACFIKEEDADNYSRLISNAEDMLEKDFNELTIIVKNIKKY